jgi:hypothetical protein
MLSDLDRRAAKLAASKFGLGQESIRRAVGAMQEAKVSGSGDLLEAFVACQLLTVAQANSLRQELDKTLIDPRGIRSQPTASRKVHGRNAPLPSDSSSFAIGSESGFDHLGPYRILRTLG